MSNRIPSNRFSVLSKLSILCSDVISCHSLMHSNHRSGNAVDGGGGGGSSYGGGCDPGTYTVFAGTTFTIIVHLFLSFILLILIYDQFFTAYNVRKISLFYVRLQFS